MDRAPVFGTGCWGFESLLDRHFCLHLIADDARSRSALQQMFLHKPSVPAIGSNIMAMRAGNIVPQRCHQEKASLVSVIQTLLSDEYEAL